MKRWRTHGLFAALALVGAFSSVYAFNAQPGFTDAFYHYNAAARLAAGDGLVDAYLWTFIGAPPTLPAPAHLYWMPGTSLVAAAGMVVFGRTYAAAQVGLALCLWGAALVGYVVGGRTGATARHRWLAGGLVLAGGFFLRFWGQTDTFAPYALAGGLALLLLGSAAARGAQAPAWLWGLAGAAAGGGHLVRTDGLLLLLTGWAVLLLAARRMGWRAVSRALLAFCLGYMLVMLPLFLRNLAAIGTLLPTGGTQAIWYTTYDDLFSYPPDANPQTFFAAGIGLLLRSRWEGLVAALGTFIAVEGVIIFAPFMLLALWRRRHDPFWQVVGLFAIGIHLAFALVFPYPGMRGGLFHAAAALFPFWLALGVSGIDDAVQWIAQRRKRWRVRTAQWVFTLGAAACVVIVSLAVALPRRTLVTTLPYLERLAAAVPAGSRIMINDPAQMYYYTGLGGVTFPNEASPVLAEVARQYGIDYVLVEVYGGVPALPAPLVFDLDAPPPFLREVPPAYYTAPSVRLYAVVLPDAP